jgi:hypothetical protein
MRIRKHKDKGMVATRPKRNASMQVILIALIAVVTAAMVFWVFTIGKKAEDTTPVILLNQAVHKNDVITEDMIENYPMLTGEYEKYADPDNDGYSRIIEYTDNNVEVLTGMVAAYAIPPSTIAMTNMFVAQVIDNSDTVLYSFPGKNLINLTAGEGDLTAFKSFLEPGDRVNITAIFSTQEDTYVTDPETGERVSQTVDVYREEPLFNDIMLADLLNSDGASILDLYTYYNGLSIGEQVALDNDEDWQGQVEPSSLMVALTPEEQTRYYQYLSKSNVEFHISLPQRTS